MNEENLGKFILFIFSISINSSFIVSLESFKLLEETVSCQNEEIKELKLKVNQILKLLKTEPNEMKNRSTPLKCKF